MMLAVAGDALRVRTDRRSPLGQVSVVGRNSSGRGLPLMPLRVLDTYAVVYLLAGRGRFADASGHRTDLGPGDLLLLFPGVGHTYGPVEGARWTEVYVLFDGPVFDLWRDHRVLDPARPVRHLEPIDRWRSAFDGVLASNARPGPGAGLVDVCDWQAVLAGALDAADREPPRSAEQRWLTQAVAVLDADERRETDLPGVAAELGMSYDGFRKRFRRLAGTSPERHRSTRAIERACQLMAEHGLTDRQIAARLGYCDEFHFSHRFRAATGRSPRQFRAALPPLR